MSQKLLLKILSQPASPFRETPVKNVITDALTRGGVAHFEDPVGNVVVGAASKADLLKKLARASKEPLRVFVAHMDHPGFLGTRWVDETGLAIRWYGGSPLEGLEGSRVWLADNGGFVGEGVLTQPKIDAKEKALGTAVVRVAEPMKFKATTLFGGWKFQAPVWIEGSRLYTKAADDLVGAYCITQLALDLCGKKAKKRDENFLAVLTRAEEEGFIGWIAHTELGWFQKSKRRLLAVSLETSRELPGVSIGKGPVVRLGDKASTFDPGAMQVQLAVAKKVLGKNFQKRVMDAGTCEGSVSLAQGIPTIAISIPLGNYHNIWFPHGDLPQEKQVGPHPEWVSLDDIKGMLKLARGLMKTGLPWENPWGEKLRWFKKLLDRRRKLLNSIR
jgi:endoglucanase